MREYITVTVTRPALDPAERDRRMQELKKALAAFFAARERRKAK